MSEALVATARRRIALAAGAWSGRPSVLRSGGGGLGMAVESSAAAIYYRKIYFYYIAKYYVAISSDEDDEETRAPSPCVRYWGSCALCSCEAFFFICAIVGPNPVIDAYARLLSLMRLRRTSKGKSTNTTTT